MNERVVALDGPIPTRPSVTQVDVIMRAASAQLGEKWHAVWLSGCWVFQQQGAAGVASRRTFLNAMAASLDAKITVKS